jgi:Ca-activated chloride channel homolog
MNRSIFTYRLGLLFVGVFVWELIFWILFWVLTFAFGFYEALSTDDLLSYRYPALLWLLLVLIPVLCIYFFRMVQINKSIQLVSPSVQKFLLVPISSFYVFIKYFFFRNALVCLIFAMAQPIYGNKIVKGTMENMELVIALDISNSMNTKDIDKGISRLEIGKRAIVQLVNNLRGEKLGICVFAGGAYVQLPVTSDYGAAKMFIHEIETNMISKQGTNVAQALETSCKMFSEAGTNRGLILMTDGENHEESPQKNIETVLEKKIQLCVLGLGTAQGGLVPNNPKRPEFGYKRSAYGNQVVSKINTSFIHSLGKQAHGYSQICSDPYPNLTGLLTQINRMKRTKGDEMEFNIKENRFQIPLILSFGFWILFAIWPGKPFHQIETKTSTQ